MEGWIKLHRTLLDKAIWSCSLPAQKCVLITLLLMVNNEERQWIWKGEKFTCNPGQIVTSLESIAKKAEVSVRSVRTALVNFEKLEFLTNESTKSGRLITIINWEEYQISSAKPTNRSTKHRQSTDKAPTTNKNIYIEDIYKSFHIDAKKKFEKKKITAEELSMYTGFISFLFGKTTDNDVRLDRCLSLDNQIDYEKFKNLMSKYDRGLIKDKILRLENWLGVKGNKASSFSITLNNWCNKDDKRGI